MICQMKYAKVIIDISAEQVDKAFTYRIPDELMERIAPGVRVRVRIRGEGERGTAGGGSEGGRGSGARRLLRLALRGGSPALF